MKQWDFAKDLVMGKKKSEILQNLDDYRKQNINNYHHRNTKNNIIIQDHFDRPERRILLIHGQPGLGKTTLAHVVAQTAGYSVIEINARYESSFNYYLFLIYFKVMKERGILLYQKYLPHWK